MLSIIIPVLNEAEIITELLQKLPARLSGKYRADIIFVDGGSTDGTQSLINTYVTKTVQPQSIYSIRLLSSEKGRAKQMNEGAKHALSEILYFLHADSFPPKKFDKYIVAEVNKGNPAGCFRLKFDSNHWWLQLAGWLTRFNWKACRGGDQSQFITKQLFNSIGGFDEDYIIYEDNILIGQLYKRKKFVVLPKKLTTSARLYRQKGVWNLQYHFWAIYVKRWFGADADELYQYYLKHIKQVNSTEISKEKLSNQIVEN
ncbi:TIGR04283 family arsenosugar biosynthesis glycosyltransferase [Aequorivita flava]|uniref:TIGR04283 family arsenosugar biosynthesis glycosyltransferase n=1 Tax=Aequorivita flava TaxID=3114371 RepID=A0AB35YPU9_9FLAO